MLTSDAPDYAVFNSLLRKAGFSSIATFRLYMKELAADRGPPHKMAATCMAAIQQAITAANGILEVKRMYRATGAAPKDPGTAERDEAGCKRLEKLLAKMRSAVDLMEPHRSKKSHEPAHSPADGLKYCLGKDGIVVLKGVTAECLDWAKKHHPNYADYWIKRNATEKEVEE